MRNLALLGLVLLGLPVAHAGVLRAGDAPPATAAVDRNTDSPTSAKRLRASDFAGVASVWLFLQHAGQLPQLGGVQQAVLGADTNLVRSRVVVVVPEALADAAKAAVTGTPVVLVIDAGDALRLAWAVEGSEMYVLDRDARIRHTSSLKGVDFTAPADRYDLQARVEEIHFDIARAR